MMVRLILAAVAWVAIGWAWGYATGAAKVQREWAGLALIDNPVTVAPSGAPGLCKVTGRDMFGTYLSFDPPCDRVRLFIKD